jgi:basic membrane protein A
MQEPISRRKFLGVSTAITAGAAVGGLAIGGVAGYLVGSGGAGITNNSTSKKIKAGFVYVGPPGDFGYTYAHDVGRKYALAALPWLTTTTAENVTADNTLSTCDSMISEGCDIVFTTSFDFMDGTVQAAAKYPNKLFAHCSGYKSGANGAATKNMSTYFADFYQNYYLCGLAAGAVTQTGNIGYVAAHATPEVIRHINAYVMGAQEVYNKKTGKNIKAYLQDINNWYDPTAAKNAAQALVDNNNCDVLAFTEDSPTVLQVAEDYTVNQNKKVWSFSHYSDMTAQGPHAHLTGQVVAWGPQYVDMLLQTYGGDWNAIDIWSRAGDYMPYRWATANPTGLDNIAPAAGAEDMRGAVYMAPLNTAAIGSDVSTLIIQRWNAMKELLFEPYIGPIKDMDGNVQIAAGVRATHDDLWNMTWFIENVQNSISE